MMSPTNDSPDELRDAFYELAMAQPMPDAETLDELIRLYPEHADALTAFAIDLTVDALTHGDETFVTDESEAVSPTVARAMSAYQNRMYELQQTSISAPKSKSVRDPVDRANAVTVDNLFIGLDRGSIRNLAECIGANPTFVSKLRDRMINIATIPLKLQELVAQELKIPFQFLTAHLSAESAVQAPGQHYKSVQKPVLCLKQSYEDAVRSSGLTEEQQWRLLSL